MSKRPPSPNPSPGQAPSPVPAESRTPRREAVVQAAAVFAVALAARLLHFWMMRDSVLYDVLVCDARQYDVWAQRLAGGDWMGTEVFYQTPLYPYFLGMIYTAFGHSVWAVRIVQALFGAAACVFTARAGSGFFSSRVGWVAGMLLAVYPPAIFFDGILQKASLDLVFMTGMLWTVAAAQVRPRAGLMLLAGLLLGAMTLNRENAVVLVPLLAAWAVWLAWREAISTKVAYCAAILAGIAAVLLPVGWRNYHVGGQFLLTTSQMGPNFYIGNHAGASGLYQPLRDGRGDPMFESMDARLLAEEDLGRKLSAKEVSDYWMERTWRDIREAPGAWMRLMAWKWFLTWNTLEFVDAESVRAHRRESLLLASFDLVLSFGVLCPLAAAGIWFTRHDWRRLWVLYAMLVLFAVAVTLFFVFARYRYPLVPVAALFAGAGVIGAWDMLRGSAASKGRELAVAAALAAVVAIVCNWPLTWLYNDEVTYITAGTGLLDDRRAADAMVVLKEATKLNPRSPEAFNNLGVAATQLNQLDEARRNFERAIQLNPRVVAPYHGLGEVYEKLGDRQRAIGYWQQAIKLDPQFAEPHRSLGSALLASGDPETAIRYLERSLQLDGRLARAEIDLALAHLAQGNSAEAARHLQQATRMLPKVAEANNLAWILATAPDEKLRNAKEAVRLADLACKASDYELPDLLDTLAAANANAGNFDAALKWSDKAIKLARESQKQPLVEAFESRRRLYAEQQPYRDPALAVKPAAAKP